jgi:transposase
VSSDIRFWSPDQFSLSPDIEISTGAINTIRCRLSESLATLVEEAATSIRHEKVTHLDETGGPIGNADGNNPERKRGWLWVLAKPSA